MSRAVNLELRGLRTKPNSRTGGYYETTCKKSGLNENKSPFQCPVKE